MEVAFLSETFVSTDKCHGVTIHTTIIWIINWLSNLTFQIRHCASIFVHFFQEISCNQCVIWASHIGVADDSGVTGCDTSSSLWFWDCLVPEDEGTAFLRTVGNHQVNGTASHSRRSTSSVVIRFRPADTLAYFVILIVEAWNCSQMGQGMPLSIPFRPNNCTYGPIIMCTGMWIYTRVRHVGRALPFTHSCRFVLLLRQT